PRLLFISAGAMTLLTLLLLWRLMPDLFYRTLLWFRWLPRYRLEVAGSNHIPGSGPAILVTNVAGAVSSLQLVSATDRILRFVELAKSDEVSANGTHPQSGPLPPPGENGYAKIPRERSLGQVDGRARTGTDTATFDRASQALQKGHVIALPLLDHVHFDSV